MRIYIGYWTLNIYILYIYIYILFIMNKHSASSLMERIIKARFNSKYFKLTSIKCYSPTNDPEDEVKEDWYEQIHAEVAKVPQHDLLLVMEDMNAKNGLDNTDREREMVGQGCETINNNGKRLVNFCLNNNCVIGRTIL